VRQVGSSLHDYIEMHCQQNIKFVQNVGSCPNHMVLYFKRQ